MKTLKSFDDVIAHYEDGSIGQIHGPNVRVKFTLDVVEGQFNVYDGWIYPSWITLYADEGTIDYAVDHYPTGNEYVLFDITE